MAQEKETFSLPMVFMLSTTELKLVHTNAPGSNVVAAVYTGYQIENGVCITLFVYHDGERRVLVTLGQHVICEFDMPKLDPLVKDGGE